jgi:hypothetical protein
VVACAPQLLKRARQAQGRSAFDYDAIDLHKKESQIRIISERGEALDRRIATSHERLTAVFGERRRWLGRNARRDPTFLVLWRLGLKPAAGL